MAAAAAAQPAALPPPPGAPPPPAPGTPPPRRLQQGEAPAGGPRSCARHRGGAGVSPPRSPRGRAAVVLCQSTHPRTVGESPASVLRVGAAPRVFPQPPVPAPQRRAPSTAPAPARLSGAWGSRPGSPCGERPRQSTDSPVPGTPTRTGSRSSPPAPGPRPCSRAASGTETLVRGTRRSGGEAGGPLLYRPAPGRELSAQKGFCCRGFWLC